MVAGLGVRVLLDEMLPVALAQEMRKLNYDVVSIKERGLGQRRFSDPDVLSYATNDNRAVLTFNVKHFALLDAQRRAARRPHAGIINSPQGSDVGVLVRRLRHHLDTTSPASQHNQISWLPNI